MPESVQISLLALNNGRSPILFISHTTPATFFHYVKPLLGTITWATVTVPGRATSQATGPGNRLWWLL
ncbi:MAG: hypothetical protein KDE56_34245, partial [Anaerolineales bacterium]|nr:hypothetical protein [Anaerolineales bacterium]